MLSEVKKFNWLRTIIQKKKRVDFNTLNSSKERIKTYDTGHESEWERDVFTDISDSANQIVIFSLATSK